MARHAYTDHLKNVRLFSGLSNKELDKVAQIATQLDYSPGRVLMREGETAHEMFVVVEGTLDVTREGEHLADLGPGSFAGEMALLTHSHRSATVTAKTDVSVLHIDGRGFSSVLNDVPQIAVKMLPIVASRVVDISDNHED